MSKTHEVQYIQNQTIHTVQELRTADYLKARATRGVASLQPRSVALLLIFVGMLQLAPLDSLRCFQVRARVEISVALKIY